MKLPGDYDDSSKLSPSVVSAIVAVTLFVATILIVVLLINGGMDSGNSTAEVKESTEETSGQAEEQSYPEVDDLLSGSTLLPEDLEFWDLYPEKQEEEPPKPSQDAAVENTENDPSTDGRHTLIQYANGEEEWVLISPYLPKHGYDFTKLVCQSSLMKYYVDGKQVSFVGADISKYNDYVDFNKLKKAGADFVMIRVGARGYGSGQLVMDDYFADNMKRAYDAGLQIGVYFYSQAITQEEAVEEANLVLENIAEYQITYPVAFQMEYVETDTARVEKLSKSEKTTIAKAFLDTVKEAGYIPMLYGDKEWLVKKVDMSKLTAYDIWLSQPGDIPDYPYKFTIWQYSNTGSINGIAGMSNLNISFIDYAEK